MIQRLEDIVTAARSRGKKRLIAAFAQDLHTIEAIDHAVSMELIDATLVGERKEIEKVCEQAGIDSSRFRIVEESNDMDCVTRAVKMVGEGEGDILMKGLVSTDKYMRGILSKECGLVPPKGTLSHVTVLELPSYHKLLVVSDVAVIPYPDFNQKRALVRYLAATARNLGVACPKIACIAPSEQVLPNVVSSSEAALLAKMGDRGQFGNVLIDGPLSLDLALVEEMAVTKKFKGNGVAGDPDCLLFPNIDAANVFFKSATKLCGANLAAIVAGAKVPCVLTSRGDTKESKLYSIALACLSAK